MTLRCHKMSALVNGYTLGRPSRRAWSIITPAEPTHPACMHMDVWVCNSVAGNEDQRGRRVALRNGIWYSRVSLVTASAVQAVATPGR